MTVISAYIPIHPGGNVREERPGNCPNTKIETRTLFKSIPKTEMGAINETINKNLNYRIKICWKIGLNYKN